MSRHLFHRTDANQAEIVKTLRALGLRVHVWGEHADLICQFGGVTMLCEVRQSGQPKKARKGRQEEFQKEFMVYWLSDADDCLALAKTLRRWQSATKAD